MAKVYLFLADGFEEIEALTVVDLLRRADQEVITVSIKEGKSVMGAHQIEVMADALYKECDYADADMLVLPGGGEGTTNLENYKPLCDMVRSFVSEGRKVAAICAAPRILAGLGLLEGRRATSYPSVMECLKGAEVSEESVVVDGCITTSRGLGTAIDFSLELIRQLDSSEKASEIADSVVYKA